MEKKFKNENHYLKAKKRVGELKSFYGHLFSFIVFNMGLFVFNAITTPNHLWFDHWFYWQVLIWGIGLIIHGMYVFNFIPFLNKEWEERKIKEFIDKEEQNKNSSE